MPTDRPALYLVTYRRRDGRVRILAEFTEPRAALEHARLLRWAGDPAEVMLARPFEEREPDLFEEPTP